MSEKSKEIAARRAALGLKVISNEPSAAPADSSRTTQASTVQAVASNEVQRRAPGAGKIVVAAVDGDSQALEVKAATFAAWLEEQYHGNIAPFHFLSDIALNVDDFPEEAVVNRAVAMMQARGWSVSVHYYNSAGCRAGSVTMMHPNSVGF